MEARATEAGLASILCNTTAAAFREVGLRAHAPRPRRRRDDLHLLRDDAPRGRARPLRSGLLDDGARLVFVNGALDGLRRPVASPSTSATPATLATRHLIALGHRRIGFVAGPADYLPTREKAAGPRRGALRGGSRAERLVAHGDFTLEGGRTRGTRDCSSRGDRPTGVICSSDVIAIGVLQEARRARAARPRGPLGRRLRRDRGGVVGRPAADDDRAANRRDRHDRDRAPADGDRGAPPVGAARALPTAPPQRGHDGRSSRALAHRHHVAEAGEVARLRGRRRRARAPGPPSRPRPRPGRRRREHP